ncbi:MAG: calcium/sodium antiporter [Phycisphaerae bacterium]
MNIITAAILLAIGLLMLWKSADWLVVGAVSLAERLKISPLVIGLTIIAMGTSAPEAATSIAAAIRNSGEVAIGNVFGSNIANLLLAGGLCALIRPILIQPKILKREMPVMLLSALALWPILANMYLSRTESIILLVAFAGLIILTAWSAKRQPDKKPLIEEALEQQAGKIKPKTLEISITFIVIGILGLGLGAEFSIRGAIYIGQVLGLSNTVIGLTIIAVGTSLPEIATCIVAAVKGQHDISIGNLVGSNIFNTLLVTGIAGAARPFALPPRLAGTDFWIMVVVSAVFIAMAAVGKKISRIKGAFLVAGYAGYIAYLLMLTANV